MGGWALVRAARVCSAPVRRVWTLPRRCVPSVGFPGIVLGSLRLRPCAAVSPLAGFLPLPPQKKRNACTPAELALATASVRPLEGVPAAGSRTCVLCSRWFSPCSRWYLCACGWEAYGCAGSVVRGVPVCGRSLGQILHSSGLPVTLGLPLSVASRKLSSGARTRRTGAERNARRGAPL